MTPEQNERYDKRCRECWAELNQIIVKYMRADEDIDVVLALGALTAELVYVIHNSFDGDDRQKFFEHYVSKMRGGLKQMKTVEDLKKMTLTP